MHGKVTAEHVHAAQVVVDLARAQGREPDEWTMAVATSEPDDGLVQVAADQVDNAKLLLALDRADGRSSEEWIIRLAQARHG